MAPTGRIRIVVVDDHALVLDTMVTIMGLEPDFEIVGTAMTVEEAVRVTADEKPDVVVIDYRLPDGDGVDGTRQILGVVPRAKVIMLTGMDDPALRAQAFDAGCSGFVAKGARLDELSRAVRAAAAVTS